MATAAFRRSHQAGLLAATLLFGACNSEPTGSDLTGSPSELARGGTGEPLVVTPSTLQLTTPGLSRTLTATVQYSSVLTATTSSPRCATVSPSSTTSREKPAGSSVYVAQFTVTPVGAETCTVSISDKKGNMVAVGVHVILARIAFSSSRIFFHEIFVMDPNGQNPTRLTTSTIDGQVQPSWSPDRSKIAFSSYLGDFNTEIFVMDADGQNPTRLTFSDGDDSSPTWSPDGTRIAFASNRDGNTAVWVMDADGQHQTRLTNNTGIEQGTKPTWSPDGTRIAFQSTRDGHDQIYVMDPDGQSQIRVTNNAAFDLYPEWSPDGTKIVFVRIEDPPGETLGEIYVMDADGQNQVRLTNNTAQEYWPTWSPAGTRIAFESTRDGNPEIYVMDANGQNQTRLTNDSDSGEDITPAWR